MTDYFSFVQQSMIVVMNMHMEFIKAVPYMFNMMNTKKVQKLTIIKD